MRTQTDGVLPLVSSPGHALMCINLFIYTPMRTNIVIDDTLMKEALELTGLRTKREAVETALRLMVQLKRQESARALRGRLQWEGDLDEARRSR